MTKEFIDHIHPVEVHLPPLPGSVTRVIESLDDCAGNLSDLTRTTDKILDKIQDEIWTRNFRRGPQDMYKDLYLYYLDKDTENQAELEGLFRMYRYNYRDTVLAYEAKFNNTNNIGEL